MNRGPAVPVGQRIKRHAAIDAATGCWNWTGCVARNGYAKVSTGSKVDGTKRAAYAHREAYKAFVGPIPDGMEIDHLCRNRRCVNPRHMEPVTRKINTLRGISPAARYAPRTHCIRGHPFSGDNLRISARGLRVCRECCRVRAAGLNQARDEALRELAP